jgi:hypothetical protein
MVCALGRADVLRGKAAMVMTSGSGAGVTHLMARYASVISVSICCH